MQSHKKSSTVFQWASIQLVLPYAPDGKEVWVSNHISDSVSVIDNDKKSPTYLNVIATVQEFDANRATSFDEPVGIAFCQQRKSLRRPFIGKPDCRGRRRGPKDYESIKNPSPRPTRDRRSQREALCHSV